MLIINLKPIRFMLNLVNSLISSDYVQLFMIIRHRVLPQYISYWRRYIFQTLLLLWSLRWGWKRQGGSEKPHLKNEQLDFTIIKHAQTLIFVLLLLIWHLRPIRIFLQP